MKLKTSVAIAMGISLGLLALILIAGLFVPKSVLVSLSKDKKAAEASLQDTTVTVDQASTASAGDQSSGAQNSDSSTPASQTPAAGGSTATGSTGTATATGTATGGSSGGTGSGSTGGGAAAVAPSLTFSASPTSITAGGSSTLSWSIANGATAPVSCTATGGTFAGSKNTSGSQAVSPTSTISYSLVCSNSAGSSGTKTVSVSVSAPPSSCSAGGTCSASDIAPHNSNGNCWVGITGSGYNKVYIITSAFNSSHVSTAGKNAASATRTCGKVISIGTLKGYNGDHTNGTKIGGSTFDQWMSSFYYANYQ